MIDCICNKVKELEKRLEKLENLTGKTKLSLGNNGKGYKFSKASRDKLETCHPDIQKVCNEAIKFIDFRVTEGHRDEATQNKYFATGASKVKWPNGYHNQYPSLAFDAIPYPLPSDDNYDSKEYVERIYELAKVLKKCADRLDIPLDWGQDLWGWDTWHYQLTSYKHK